MPWLLLTILAVLSRGSYSIATKLVSQRITATAPVQAVLLTGCGAALALASSPLFGGLSLTGLSEVLLPTLAMVVAQGAGNVLFFRGIASLDAGTAQIAFSSILLWSVGLSVVVLNSTFSGVQLSGAVVLLGAILLAQWGPTSRRNLPGVLLIVAAAACFAVFQVTSAEVAHKLTPATYLVLAYGGSCLLVAAVFPSAVRRQVPDVARQWRRNGGVLLLAAVLSFGYFALSYFAYRVAPDRGVVVVLLTTQVVLSVVLGILLLHERDGAGRKLGAAALAVAGSWLLVP